MSEDPSSSDTGLNAAGTRDIGAFPPFRPPKQDRSRQTLDRIASAALELMEEEGVDGATIATIVERSQASVGSFYARFSGKEDLVRHLQERVWTEARGRWDEALAGEVWEGLSMARVVEGVVGLLIRSLEADYRRRRVLGRDRASDPEAAQHVRSFHEHLLATVTPLLMSRRGEITHPEPDSAVRFGYRVVVGGIREFLEMEPVPGGPSPGTEEASGLSSLGPELARMWIGYLRPGAGAVEELEAGEVDFFDPWG